MTQEQKGLLLKDLCARLPYGVKIKTSYNKIDEPIELIFINPRNESFAIGSNFTITSGLSFDIYECKPYLFPLSSMTEEQKEEFNQIFELKLKAINGEIDYTEVTAFETDFYSKYHFDWKGLIPLGLALGANNLNIY